MSERVFILGAGRAGRGLARALRASGTEVVGVHGRRAEEGVSAGEFPEALRGASVVLVAVQDGVLDAALQSLVEAPLAPNAVVLHASGSADPPSLATLRDRGHPVGTFHPLVPVADPASAPALLLGAWIGIDGDPVARSAARALAARLGAHALDIPAGSKARYHAAAVLASNFGAVLLSLAERVLATTGISADAAHAALLPLALAAATNLRTLGGPDALTGPVARGDVDTVRAHLNALAADSEALAAYRALSLAALPLARERGVDPSQLDALRALLEGT